MNRLFAIMIALLLSGCQTQQINPMTGMEDKIFDAPEPDHDVERGFVVLYIFKQDKIAAKKQIDYFIKVFPNSPDRKIFEKMRSALDDGEIKVRGIQG